MAFLTKRKDGVFIPSDSEAMDFCGKIPVGDEVKISLARNPKFHRKFFALLKLGFENQERLDTMEKYRMVTIMKAGFFEIVPNKNGEPYYIPQSIAFEKMDEEKFNKLFDAVLGVISKQLESSPEALTSELANFY